jgi:hypothetical protein
MFIILLVFMFGFGTVMQALQYHNQELDYSLLTNSFIPTFFSLGGQYFELSGALNATQNMYPGKIQLKIKYRIWCVFKTMSVNLLFTENSSLRWKSDRKN